MFLSCSNQHGISLSQLRGLSKIPILTLSSLPLPALYRLAAFLWGRFLWRSRRAAGEGPGCSPTAPMPARGTFTSFRRNHSAWPLVLDQPLTGPATLGQSLSSQGLYFPICEMQELVSVMSKIISAGPWDIFSFSKEVRSHGDCMALCSLGCGLVTRQR